jgi:hypothetical protein
MSVLHYICRFAGLAAAVVVSASCALNESRPNTYGPSCAHDREQLLSLSEKEFDQPAQPEGGWRGLTAKAGCGLVAADPIRDYRARHQSQSVTLRWHEGQLRAMAGQRQEAILLMVQSKWPREQDAAGWNLYVDATVAFLRDDYIALKSARDALAAVLPPAESGLRLLGDGHVELKLFNGQTARRRWPPNLDVVDGLLRCFGKPYGDAYRTKCRRSQ